VRALGAQKTRLFLSALKEGVDPAIGAEALLKRLRTAGIGTAVGSSSKNASAILHAAGLNRLIDVRVDGMDAEALGLPGKPDPALFLEAAQRLGARPARTILFEDALAGVEAGDRGGFGRVVGIDRGRQMGALLRHGADAIIRSLREVKVEES
jgi:alpha,alpha-trehalase